MSPLDPGGEREWQRLLAAPLPGVDPGLTLRVLTELPRRSQTTRLRAQVLLLAALIAALLLMATVMPAMAQPTGVLGALLLCLGGAALAFWGLLALAD